MTAQLANVDCRPVFCCATVNLNAGRKPNGLHCRYREGKNKEFKKITYLWPVFVIIKNHINSF